MRQSAFENLLNCPSGLGLYVIASGTGDSRRTHTRGQHVAPAPSSSLRSRCLPGSDPAEPAVVQRTAVFVLVVGSRSSI